MGLSVFQIVAAVLVTFSGALLQGSVGFGLGLFAVPFLVIIEPAFVPGPLLLAAVLLTILMYFRDHAEVRVNEFCWAATGRVLGSIVGAYFLTIVPAKHLKPLFAILVIVAVVLSSSGLRLRLTPRNLLAAGTVSGFMATVAAIGGAPMALVYQYEKGSKLRGTLAAVFIVGTIFALISLIVVKKFNVADVFRALLLMPGIVLGFVLSRKSAQFLDRGYLRPAILIISTFAALTLIVDSWLM